MKARTVLYTASWQARPEGARGPLRRGGEGPPRGGTVWQGLHGAKGQGGHQVCREPPWPHLRHRVAREGGRGHGRSFRHAHPRVGLCWRRRWCRGSFAGDRWPCRQAGQRWATARPGGVGQQLVCRETARHAAGHYKKCLNWANALEQPPASLRGGCSGPHRDPPVLPASLRGGCSGPHRAAPTPTSLRRLPACGAPSLRLVAAPYSCTPQRA